MGRQGIVHHKRNGNGKRVHCGKCFPRKCEQPKHKRKRRRAHTGEKTYKCISRVVYEHFQKFDIDIIGSLLIVVSSFRNDNVKDFTENQNIPLDKYLPLLTTQIAEYCGYGKKKNVEKFCGDLFNSLNEILEDEELVDQNVSWTITYDY